MIVISSNNGPLVSVVIPTYNDGETRLVATIKSVLDQTHSNIEVLVSDDGSHIPFSGVEAQIYDDRVRWLKNGHQGVANTRNSGLSLAKGDYIAFLDTGDYWESEKIEKQLLLFQMKPNLVMVYANALTHDAYGRTGRLSAEKRGFLFCDLLVGQPIVGSCSSVLIPKAILDRCGGFYTGHDIPEDQELWLRISRLGEVDFVDEYLVHLEVGLMSRSADPVKKMKPYQHFLEMYSKELREQNLEASAWANYYISIADKFFSKGEFIQGMKHLTLGFGKKVTRSGLARIAAGFFSLFGPKAYSFTKHVYRNKKACNKND